MSAFRDNPIVTKSNFTVLCIPKKVHKRINPNLFVEPDAVIECMNAREACEGHYIDKNCPFADNVSIRGCVLTGTIVGGDTPRLPSQHQGAQPVQEGPQEHIRPLVPLLQRRSSLRCGDGGQVSPPLQDVQVRERSCAFTEW